MFDKFRKPSKFDAPMDKLLREMEVHDSDSTEWEKSLAYLERIKALQETERRRVSPDTMAIVAGNLLGILIMVGYERGHILTTKALGQLFKSKLH